MTLNYNDGQASGSIKHTASNMNVQGLKDFFQVSPKKKPTAFVFVAVFNRSRNTLIISLKYKLKSRIGLIIITARDHVHVCENHTMLKLIG